MLDAGKAERELGWQPAWDVAEAVAATVRWYRQRDAGASADRLAALCRDDISATAAAAAAAGAAWAVEVPR